MQSGVSKTLLGEERMMTLSFTGAILAGIKVGLFGIGIVAVILAVIFGLVLALVILELIIEFCSWLKIKYEDFMWKYFNLDRT